MRRILVIKNGECETDIKYIINKIDPTINVNIISSIELFKTTDPDKIINRYNGVIILGGNQTLTNRHEISYKHTYLNDLIKCTRVWIEKKVKILGICLGAQIIGEAVGHKTIKMKKQITGYTNNINVIKS